MKLSETGNATGSAGTRLSAASDATLLRIYAEEGRGAAFEELVRRHHKMIYATAVRACKHSQDAEDVLQNTLTLLARRAATLGKVKCLGAWLHRAATLESMNMVRKNINRREREQTAMANLSADENSTWKKVSPLLDRCLLSLSEKDREVIVLHYIEGNTFARVAKQIGSSPDACRKRCARAIEKLSAKFKRHGATVAVTTLTACLAAVPSKATASSYTIAQLTQTAISQAHLTAASTITANTITAMLINKGIIISAIGGIAVSAAFATLNHQEKKSNTDKNSAQSATRNHQQSQKPKESILYSIERLKPSHDKLSIFRESIQKMENSEYSQIDEVDLLALVFTMDKEEIPEALDLLHQTERHKRYSEIAANLYARLADFSPEEAFSKALKDEKFKYSARKGVYMSWLSSNPDKAIGAMKQEWDRRQQAGEKMGRAEHEGMSDYLLETVYFKPESSAKLYERAKELWPEGIANVPTIWVNRWAESNPQKASEWVMDQFEPEEAESMFSSISGTLAQTNPQDALQFTDMINDPKLRDESRSYAIQTWSSNDGFSANGVQSANGLDLSKGFPDGWSSSDIDAFARGISTRHITQVNQLLRLPIAKDQKNAVIQGVLHGAAEGNTPESYRHLVSDLPDEFLTSTDGAAAVQRYMTSLRSKNRPLYDKWIQKNPRLAPQQ
ncbi:MAG: RNA polymerase sigma factor [Akkermansiaceae bacterium]